MQVLVMGVSGAGKTTIAQRLAEALGARFIEGDDFHPPANIERMAAGEPLDDDCRHHWLLAIAAELRRAISGGEEVVLACSALKERYRHLLLAGCPDCHIVWLRGDQTTIAERLNSRAGHFMPPSLLFSQFSDLEAPAYSIAADVSRTPDEIVEELIPKLRAAGANKGREDDCFMPHKITGPRPF